MLVMLLSGPYTIIASTVLYKSVMFMCMCVYYMYQVYMYCIYSTKSYPKIANEVTKVQTITHILVKTNSKLHLTGCLVLRTKPNRMIVTYN